MAAFCGFHGLSLGSRPSSPESLWDPAHPSVDHWLVELASGGTSLGASVGPSASRPPGLPTQLGRGLSSSPKANTHNPIQEPP